MNKNIVIVTAVPEDVEGIRIVQREAWLVAHVNEKLGVTKEDIEETFDDSTDEAKQKIEKRKKSLNADDDSHIWVAKDGRTVVGFCTAKKEGNSNRIEAIYLLPDYHGKGIGKRLMQIGLEWLGDEKDIFVQLASYNEKAKSFYINCGFVETGEKIEPFVDRFSSGVIIPEIEMVKKHNVNA